MAIDLHLKWANLHVLYLINIVWYTDSSKKKLITVKDIGETRMPI